MSEEAIKPGTPLPWSWDHDEENGHYGINAPDGSEVAWVFYVDNAPSPEGETDAAYIVHTANNYPTLAAHAERMAEALERVLDNTHSYESEGQARDYARQALTEYRSSQL